MADHIWKKDIKEDEEREKEQEKKINKHKIRCISFSIFLISILSWEIVFDIRFKVWSLHHLEVSFLNILEHSGSFQNILVSSLFNWVSRYILFLAKIKGRGRPFLRVEQGGSLWDYPQEHLVVIRDKKVSPFVKFEINLPFLCFSLDPLTNKHCRTWSSIINLWIDFRTSQK